MLLLLFKSLIRCLSLFIVCISICRPISTQFLLAGSIFYFSSTKGKGCLTIVEAKAAWLVSLVAVMDS